MVNRFAASYDLERALLEDSGPLLGAGCLSTKPDILVLLGGQPTARLRVVQPHKHAVTSAALAGASCMLHLKEVHSMLLRLR